jgi:hypothetical protein
MKINGPFVKIILVNEVVKRFFVQTTIGSKHEIRNHKVCGQSLKIVFEFLKKSPW